MRVSIHIPIFIRDKHKALLTNSMQINEDSQCITATLTCSNANIPITQVSHRSELAEITCQ